MIITSVNRSYWFFSSPPCCKPRKCPTLRCLSFFTKIDQKQNLIAALVLLWPNMHTMISNTNNLCLGNFLRLIAFTLKTVFKNRSFQNAFFKTLTIFQVIPQLEFVSEFQNNFQSCPESVHLGCFHHFFFITYFAQSDFF